VSNEPITEQTTPDTSGVSKVVNRSFIEPILGYIANRPPDVEDNFSIESTAWEPADPSSTKEIINDELRIEDGMYLNRKMEHFIEFVVKVDVKPTGSDFSGFFLLRTGTNFGISSNGQWVIDDTAVKLDSGTYDHSSSGFVQPSANYQLQVLLKDNQIVFIINEEPVAYYDYEPFEMSTNRLYICLWDNGVAYFDNFEAWDISQFELPFDL
jgi:hypothetical protein